MEVPPPYPFQVFVHKLEGDPFSGGTGEGPQALPVFHWFGFAVNPSPARRGDHPEEPAELAGDALDQSVLAGQDGPGVGLDDELV